MKILNKKLRQNKNNVPDKVIDSFIDEDSILYDPNGSWTGTPKDRFDKPIQDADDL